MADAHESLDGADRRSGRLFPRHRAGGAVSPVGPVPSPGGVVGPVHGEGERGDVIARWGHRAYTGAEMLAARWGHRAYRGAEMLAARWGHRAYTGAEMLAARWGHRAYRA